MRANLLRFIRSAPSVSVWGIGASWGGRLVSMIAQAVLTPLLLHLLGENQFSVYQIIASLFGWFTVCSLGFGPALKNYSARQQAFGQSDNESREAMASIVWCLLAGFIVAFGLLAHILGQMLLGRLTEGRPWADSAFLVAVILMIVIGVGQVGYEMLFVDRRGHLAYWLPALGQSAGLIVIYVASWAGYLENNRLTWVAFLWFAPQAVAALLALSFTGLLRFPRWSATNWRLIFGLARPASNFFWVALISNAVLLMDVIVIGQILPPAEVVRYTIVIGIVNVMLRFYTAGLMIFWPEWSRKWAMREYGKVRAGVLALAGWGTLGGGVIGVAMIVALPAALKLWLGRSDFDVHPATIALFSLYLAMRVWVDTHSTALMACNRPDWLVTTMLLQVPLNLVGMILLGKLLGSAGGVVAGLILGYLATIVWLWPWKFYGMATRAMRALPPLVAGK